jgi:hypothetical protein
VLEKAFAMRLEKDFINLEYKCESHNATFATISKDNFDVMFEKFEARRINELSEFLSTLPFFASANSKPLKLFT